MDTTMASTTSSHRNTELQDTETQTTSCKKIKLSDYRKWAKVENVAVFDEKLKQPRETGLFRPDMMCISTSTGPYETLPSDVRKRKEINAEIDSAPPSSTLKCLEHMSSNAPPPLSRSTVTARWDPSEKAFPPLAPTQVEQPALFSSMTSAGPVLAHQPVPLQQEKTIFATEKQNLTTTPEENALHNKVDKERAAVNVKATKITARQRQLTEQLEAIEATPIKLVDDVVRDLLKNPLIEGIDYENRPKPQPRPFNKPTRLRQPRKDESISERAYNEQQRNRRWHDVINGRCSVHDQETRFEFASTYSSLPMTELSDECTLRGLILHQQAQQDGSYLVEVLQVNDHEYRKSLRLWKNSSKYELLEHDQKSSEPIPSGDLLPKEVLANAMAKRDARLAIVGHNQHVNGRLWQTEPQWSIPSTTSDVVPRASALKRSPPTPPPRISHPTTLAKQKVVSNAKKTTTPPPKSQKIINEDVIAKARAKAAQINAASAILSTLSKPTKEQTNAHSTPFVPHMKRHIEPEIGTVPTVAQPEERERKRTSSEREERGSVIRLTAAELKDDEEDSAMDISDEGSDMIENEEEERPLKKLKE